MKPEPAAEKRRSGARLAGDEPAVYGHRSRWCLYRTTPVFTAWQPLHLRRAILLLPRIVLQKRSCRLTSLEQPWFLMDKTPRNKVQQKKLQGEEK